MKNGRILCGGVGTGKSRTALAYYYSKNGGDLEADSYVRMNDPPKDLYIITTARKRDTLEWDDELCVFLMSSDPKASSYKNKVIVDSWNNIKKYDSIANAFFIFDEQRVVGSGAWVKSFLKIAKSNEWILLSATPGDTWTDYIPVFIANGFYKNRTEFIREHVIYKQFTKFRQVDRYVNTGRLIRLRNSLLVPMIFERQTVSHHENVIVDYPVFVYKDICKRRWNIFTDSPIVNASEYCYTLRRAVNTAPQRLAAVKQIVQKRKRVIIFYNFDYELELLRELFSDTDVAEWNGHMHQPIPESKEWVYLVQYTAGAEGWNCITTDTVIFYSQNYSYKIMSQASGRIDRLNTPYTDLYYYHLKSHAGIDIAIARALKEKKKFNESGFYEKGG